MNVYLRGRGEDDPTQPPRTSMPASVEMPSAVWPTSSRTWVSIGYAPGDAARPGRVFSHSSLRSTGPTRKRGPDRLPSAAAAEAPRTAPRRDPQAEMNGAGGTALGSLGQANIQIRIEPIHQVRDRRLSVRAGGRLLRRDRPLAMAPRTMSPIRALMPAIVERARARTRCGRRRGLCSHVPAGGPGRRQAPPVSPSTTTTTRARYAR